MGGWGGGGTECSRSDCPRMLSGMLRGQPGWESIPGVKVISMHGKKELKSSGRVVRPRCSLCAHLLVTLMVEQLPVDVSSVADSVQQSESIAVFAGPDSPI